MNKGVRPEKKNNLNREYFKISGSINKSTDKNNAISELSNEDVELNNTIKQNPSFK